MFDSRVDIVFKISELRSENGAKVIVAKALHTNSLTTISSISVLSPWTNHCLRKSTDMPLNLSTDTDNDQHFSLLY